MSDALDEFKAAVEQCDKLIAAAHKLDANNVMIFDEVNRRQITIAAFLNMFIGWESFLEETITLILCGELPVSGRVVGKFASPRDQDAARKMLIGTSRHFDYANHQNVIKIVEIFFDGGYPFQPHLNSVHSQLDDLRTMRNFSAHISSTTRTSLEALAVRLLARASPGIHLYDLLTANDPNTPLGATILETYKNHLLVTAELIANG